MATVDLGGEDDRLSELVGLTESGETVDFIRDGRVVARLTPPKRKPIDIEALRALAAKLPYDPVDSVAEMRRLARY